MTAGTQTINNSPTTVFLAGTDKGACTAIQVYVVDSLNKPNEIAGYAWVKNLHKTVDGAPSDEWVTLRYGREYIFRHFDGELTELQLKADSDDITVDVFICAKSRPF